MTQQTLAEYSDQITCLAVLSNGQVVSGSSDNTLRVWDVRTGQCLKTLQDSKWGTVTCLAVLPNGQVVSGSQDHTLRLWDVGVGKCLHVIDEEMESIEYLAVLPNGQMVCLFNYRCSLGGFDENMDRECMKILNLNLSHYNTTCFAVLPNGQVVCGSSDNTLRVWDVSKGQYLKALEGHTRKLTSLAVLPNGQVVSGSKDNTFQVWDVPTGECLKTLYSGEAKCFAVLPNGQVVGAHKPFLSMGKGSTLKSWTPFRRYCYDTIASVLQAITPECELQALILRRVDLGQVGYEHLRELIQNVSSLTTLFLLDTDLTTVQSRTLYEIVRQHQRQEARCKAQIKEVKEARNKLLQAQTKRIRQLETQLLTTLQGECYLQA